MDRKTVVQLMSELEMLAFIRENGTQCRIVAITTRTPVTKIKAGNPWHQISKGKVVGDCNLWKLSRKVGIVNAKYNDSVRRRIAEKIGVTFSEVEYTSGDVWYEHLLTADGKALPIVQHKDESKRAETGYSLQYFPWTEKSVNRYINGAGETVETETIKRWLYAERDYSDFKPVVIAPKLRNIIQMKASGVIVEMPDLPEVEAAFAD
jgi:hypothetical protein